MISKLSSRVVIALGVLSCLLASPSTQTILAPKVTAQSSCIAPDFQGPEAAWPPNSRITVNINSSQFTQAEFACLSTAFANWNGASGNGANESGVEFNVVYSSNQVGT